MNILIVSDTLLMGGAEWFMLRMAKSLINAGHKVVLCVTRPDHIDKRMIENFPEIPIRHINNLGMIKAAIFLDKFSNKIFKKNYFINSINSIFLRKCIRSFKPDVIHSHLLQADIKTVIANQGIGCRHIITIHGDYNGHICRGEHAFFKDIARVFEAVDAIVIITDEQKQILEAHYPAVRSKLTKIYNGYPFDGMLTTKTEKLFTFGLIARGQREKGWEEAIAAFKSIKRSDARLLLFGESAFLHGLEKSNDDPRIIFRGFTNNPIRAVQEMDIGLFTSYIKGESLPTTIIEYLMLEKPVITTNVGECKEMIRVDDKFAGIVLDLVDGKVDVAGLSKAMQTMADDEEQRAVYAGLASQAKMKFEMSKCVNAYLRIYQNLN